MKQAPGPPSGAPVTAADTEGLAHLRAIAGERFVRGILLHTGTEVVPFARDLAALPVGFVWG